MRATESNNCEGEKKKGTERVRMRREKNERDIERLEKWKFIYTIYIFFFLFLANEIFIYLTFPTKIELTARQCD